MLSEKKGTCCHKCGHVHVKGTSCPKPFLKGERSCVRRSLEEAVQKDHYIDRKKERGTIVSIEIPDYVYGDRDIQQTNRKLIPILQAKLNERLKEVEGMDLGMSNNVNLGLVVFTPVIQYKDRLIPIKMSYGKDGGYYYLVIAANNNLLTMYPASKKIADLEKDVEDHIKRERPDDVRPPKADTLSGHIYRLDIDGNEIKNVEKKPEAEKASKENLPYILKASYKPKSAFTLKEPITVKGKPVTKGVVVNASVSGQRAGEPDGNGKVDWVEVDFGEEKLAGGKVVPSYRTYKPVYTTSYKFKDSVNEMSLQNPGVEDFLKDLESHPDIREKMGFTSMKRVLDFLDLASTRDWDKLRSELRDELKKLGKELDETDSYCTSCLKEYLLEYRDKIEEAEYRGHKVQLGKPFLTPGGPKKRSVYVKNKKGNVVKVNFGDPNLRIKKSNPKRRKSFRARHKCHTAKDRTTPRYWSCKFW
jgi:hypothetical protein